MELSRNEGLCDLKDLSAILYSGRKWIKFVGIGTIIMGVFVALTLIGMLFAWLPIWMGILLVKVANRMEFAYAMEDEAAMVESMKQLKTYFIVSGVVQLIYLFFGILLFLIGDISEIPEVLKNFGY
jgi:hypothetical protein